MPSIHTDNKELPLIEIPFPEEKYNTYLAKLPVTPSGEPTTQQKKHIFISAVDDFKKGTLSLDELSSIADNLWSSLNATEKATEDLADAMYAAAELNFYLRSIDEDTESGHSFVGLMNTIMQFYNKNKQFRLK